MLKLLVIGFFGVVFTACQPTAEYPEKLAGYAQGTTYHITFFGEASKTELQKGVDSILFRMDMALSNYKSNSQIAALNATNDTLFTLTDSCGYWNQVLEISKEVYDKSEGAFDPSIYPLVKAYGFGPGQKPQLDSTLNLDSLKALVGLSQWSWKATADGRFLIQKPENGQLDFNAVAQGLAVDLISEYLESRNTFSYFVELGGEVRVGGKKPNGNKWVLGVEKPKSSGERELSDRLEIENTAVATSGSNRKYYEKSGKRYSHAIDAKTGVPVTHEVLSATVEAKSAALADAWATAALVLGDSAMVVFEQQGLKAPILLP